jgi:hypothetical protein
MARAKRDRCELSSFRACSRYRRALPCRPAQLAVSQLDANRNNEAYQKEALRTEALKWELGRKMMRAKQAGTVPA